MKVRKKKISEDDYHRIWVVGDVHGYKKTLKKLLKKLSIEENDLVIFLGDLVDRGPDSKGVIDVVRMLSTKTTVLSLLGNHEDMLLRSVKSSRKKRKKFNLFKSFTRETKAWFGMGGDVALKSFGKDNPAEIEDEYIDWLKSCYHFIKSENHLFVHAGFDFEEAEPFKKVEPMMWIREFDARHEKAGNRRILHGHTPISLDFIEELVQNPDKEKFLPLDNGVAVKKDNMKGNLIGYELKSATLIIQARVES